MATTTRNPDGTYTTTLTAREQAVVNRLAAVQTPPVTAAKVVEALIERKLREIYQQHREKEAAARQEAYDGATPQVRSTVDTALNFTPEG